MKGRKRFGRSCWVVCGSPKLLWLEVRRNVVLFLNRDTAAALIPILQRFVETGSIEEKEK